MVHSVFKTLLTLAIGGVGAYMGYLLQLPAPALVGSVVLVTFTSFLKLPLMVLVPIRNLGFTAIGCSLGASITPDVLEQAFKWPFTLSVLAICIVAIMVSNALLLEKLFGVKRADAVLGTAPGALSYTLILTENYQNQGRANVSTVTGMQSIRLLFITLILPFILDIAGQSGDFSVGAERHTLSVWMSFVIILAVYLAGIVGSKVGLPAAFIILGMMINGTLHGLVVVVGDMPDWILFTGFIITGSVVGSRFRKITLADLKTVLGAALVSVTFGITLMAGMAYFLAQWLGLPFGQLWVAFAPGGVEAMAAMAISLDFDPAFVAVHHLFRIIFLILILPIAVKILIGTEK